VVIDSLSGFEIALAPSFRQDFRESFYRLLQSLTELNITVLSTMETSGDSDYLHFSPYNISFLSDDIVAMRYIELDGCLRTVVGVIKMRGSAHSRELRLTEVTSHGLEIRESLNGYRGIITGVPEPRSDSARGPGTELTNAQEAVLVALLRLGETPATDIVNASGLTLDGTTAALEALVRARYVIVSEQGGVPVYRAAPGAVK
jgi:hypothetical protein